MQMIVENLIKEFKEGCTHKSGGVIALSGLPATLFFAFLGLALYGFGFVSGFAAGAVWGRLICSPA